MEKEGNFAFVAVKGWLNGARNECVCVSDGHCKRPVDEHCFSMKCAFCLDTSKTCWIKLNVL